MNLNPLKKWVITNKYFIKTSEPKKTKAEATHYLLDGGIWKIPSDKYLDFLRLLALDLQNGEKHYITENRTPVFKFICDLDFYESGVFGQVEEVVTVIQEVVTEYLGEYRVIICGSDPKNVVVNEQSLIKSGFHIVYPKLWVSVETAKKLRIVIIERLIEKFNERESYNTWSDVVDLAVYEDNGLRMVGCRKIAICKCCKNKKELRETCEKCHGDGKIDENRIYKPIAVVPNNPEYFDTIRNDYYVMLLETSIYNISQFEPSPLLKTIDRSIETKKRLKFKQTNDLQVKIEKFLQKNYKENYGSVSVTKFTQSENKETYYVDVDDNYCMNVNRNHTSSGIYFQLSLKGACQRCRCKKDTIDGRLHGMCKEYASKIIPLPKQLSKSLFGELSNGVSKKNKSIVTYNITRGYDKEKCLENCRNILWQLKNELI